MNKKYYLAYGSNLNKMQMARRCPQARIVGSAVLEDYELTFKYYLTIEPKDGAKTPVGVWEVNEEDERSLDIYEGYPTHYRKEYIDIEIKGKEAKALIYIMNNIREVQPPSGAYMDTCTKGYKDFGFNLDFLTDALIRSMKKPEEDD